MKVILTSRIKTLGNIGDVKVVADGYGKNYLLPKKLAIIYNEKNYSRIIGCECINWHVNRL